MNKLVRAIKEFALREVGGVLLDTEVLDRCIATLTPYEREILELGDSTISKELHERYLFMLWKVFNRHNDVCSRNSWFISDEDVEITTKSSITELDISYDTLVNCNNNFVFRICDIQKELLPTLTLESIADVTAAILTFDANVEQKTEEV